VRLQGKHPYELRCDCKRCSNERLRREREALKASGIRSNKREYRRTTALDRIAERVYDTDRDFQFDGEDLD